MIKFQDKPNLSIDYLVSTPQNTWRLNLRGWTNKHLTTSPCPCVYCHCFYTWSLSVPLSIAFCLLFNAIITQSIPCKSKIPVKHRPQEKTRALRATSLTILLVSFYFEMFNISKLFENIVDLSYIPRFDNELSKKVINVYFFTSYPKI